MKLLLVETEPGIAHPIETHLLDGGHEVVGCNDPYGGPCRGVVDHAECPLHGHVDLAIVARPEFADPTLNEMGSICAKQHRVPTVRVDPAEAAPVLEQLEATAANARRKVEAEYAAAIRRDLHIAGVTEDVTISVTRAPHRVAAVIHLPSRFSLPTQQAALSDRARHAVRTHDPFVRVIDVSTVVDTSID